jgi:hypothetical protein
MPLLDWSPGAFLFYNALAWGYELLCVFDREIVIDNA